MRQFAFSFLAGFSILFAPVAATASTLNAGEWYLFFFNYESDGDPAPLKAPPGSFGGLSSAPDGPWAFTLLTEGSIQFVDLGFAIDQFEIFNFGSSIGSTSVPVPATNPADLGCGFDILDCALPGYGEVSFSQRIFDLDPGNHSITGIALLQAGAQTASAGFGAFRLRGQILPPAPIPLPAALPLLLGGLALLGAVGRRRREARVTRA